MGYQALQNRIGHLIYGERRAGSHFKLN